MSNNFNLLVAMDLSLFMTCNVLVFIGATKGTGFAAIKVTALGRPQLLVRCYDKTNKWFKCFL